MANTLRVACVMFCTLLVAGTAPAQTPGTKPATERTTFYEDDDPDPFENSVPLPDNVLDVLRAAPEAKGMWQQIHNLDRIQFARLFRAVEVHMAGPKELDYLVLGKQPMSGGDCAWFWIVRSDRTNPKVILFTNSNGVELMKSRTNGYRDVRSVWSSPSSTNVRVYHYDGETYRLWKDKSSAETR